MNIKVVYKDLVYEYHENTNTWSCTGIAESTGKYVIPPGLIFNRDYIKILNGLRDKQSD